MAFVTVRYLQREFGMPILKAGILINKQRGVASKRHRTLWLMATICATTSAASGLFDLHWPWAISAACSFAGSVLIFLFLYLIQRDSRAPILAAARAWRASAPSHPTK